MTWNYRIIRHEDTPPWYGLHEVYYTREGQPHGWSSKPITFIADEDEGPGGVITSLEMALADARNRPILTEKSGALTPDKGVDDG